MFDFGSELQRAIQFGDLSAVRVFLRRGDDVNVVDAFGYSPIHYVAICGISDIASVVVNIANIRLNKRTPFHLTALFLSALHNHYHIFRMLLRKGADPNAKMMFGQTVLHWLVKVGKLKYIRELIKYGADVNCLDCFGMSPLRVHLQATMNIHITRLLIKCGADMNETKYESTSILQIALYRWRLDKNQNFRYLIRHGADINATTFTGETALHWAARASAPAVIKLLAVKYKADITVRDMFGHTPLDVALQFGNNYTVDTIRDLHEKEIERQMQELGI